ncbi:MAG: amidohydrolase [Actinomycetia bacterium]|nr:amidohydrolase [Actinomycetes bacterium]MCP4086904.1 amidohydrolase [Actinomycetes bacterium]
MTVTRLIADVLVTCDDRFTVHQPGAVDIDGQRIIWVGPAAEAPPGRAERVQQVGGLLMPGLVNTHCHTPMTLVRGAGDGLPLERWLRDAMWPREGRMSDEDVWWGMTLGSAEMLRSGITTSCEMYLHEEPVVEAVQASGARLVMTPAVLPALDPDVDGRLATIADLHARVHDERTRVTVGVGAHSAYELPLPIVCEMAGLAEELGALFHIHLAETTAETSDFEAEHGARVVPVLADAGVFGARTLAAHSIWLDGTDLDLYRQHGVAVAHCPQSNMKLASGVAPIKAMIERGITVGLGTDGPASNDDLDLWEEVKLTPMLARVTTGNPTLLPPAEVFTMATRAGAEAVGLGDVGVVAAGFMADLIRIDLDDPVFTPVTEPADLLAHLLWSAGGRHVSDVWVAGQQVVADHEVTTVDLSEAQRQVQDRAVRLARG